MFTAFPKIFGRDFAIGFFLPACIMFVVLIHFFLLFDLEKNISEIWSVNLPIGATVAILLLWIFSIALSAINIRIIRALEGYGKFNPFRLKKRVQEKSFDALQLKIEEMENELEEAENELKKLANDDDSEIKQKQIHRLFYELADRLVDRAQNFPSTRDQILPTAFGNTIRAFEDYPRVLYGLDSIQGWNRLLAVIPDRYLDLVAAERASVNFWVNTWLISVLLTLSYLGLAIGVARAPHPWIPFATLGSAWLCAHWARSAAHGWGVTVKAAFDVYLPALALRLGYELPTGEKRQKKFWQNLSQAFLHRQFEALEEIGEFRKRPHDRKV